jgi:anti-anti-sigma factor
MGEYPFQMIGGVPVVTAPAEVDATNAAGLRAILLEWQARGHTTVVVDLTGTQFCDSAGLSELVWAHKRAVADGGGLRLVMTGDGAVVRIVTVTGLDRLIPRYVTVKQALGQAPAAASRPLHPGPPPGPTATPADPPAHLQEPGSLAGVAADRRRCEQCGAGFVPVRERARFCSGDCRAAWNRGHFGDPAVETSTLTWLLTAMSEATALLPTVKPWDQAQVFAAIGEAVWWITMVDATLVRHHRSVYDTALAAHTPAERQLIEQTLAGLRFARNWISREAGPGEALHPGVGIRRITQWRWKLIPEPALTWLPPSAQAWELARYRAYQARLAGHTIGDTFRRPVSFLTLTGTKATSTTDTSQHPTPPLAGHSGSGMSGG